MKSKLEIVRYPEDRDRSVLFYKVMKGDEQLIKVDSHKEATIFCRGYLIGNKDTDTINEKDVYLLKPIKGE